MCAYPAITQHLTRVGQGTCSYSFSDYSEASSCPDSIDGKLKNSGNLCVRGDTSDYLR
jgi:hypothetical protein